MLRKVFLSGGAAVAARNPLWNSFICLGVAGLSGESAADGGYVVHTHQASRPWWSQGGRQQEVLLLDVFRQLAEHRPGIPQTAGPSVTLAAPWCGPIKAAAGNAGINVRLNGGV